MANIPDWVKEIRDGATATYGKGLSVKCQGGSYYLYKRESHRVPGKKNPQVKEAYIGVITRDGVTMKERGLSKVNIDVLEYGYSRVLLENCPAAWRKALKDNWKDVLLTIIQRESPNSYLLHNQKIGDVSNRNINLQERNLWDSLPAGMHTEIEPLKRVYQLAFPDRVMLANTSDMQIALAGKYGVDLTEDNIG